MKTDVLIDLLARSAGPADRYRLASRFGFALAAGAVGTFVLLLAVFGINPALQDFLSLPDFWIKVTFAGSLAAAGLIVSTRLARPGVTVGNAKAFVVLPVLALWTLAVVVLVNAEPATHAQLVFGNTWRKCPFNIALLSGPTFIAGVWALRGLAPTQQRLAGAALGQLSGALGACVYCLHCPEFAPPFLSVWYVAGMLIPIAVGYAIGPRLLRW